MQPQPLQLPELGLWLSRLKAGLIPIFLTDSLTYFGFGFFFFPSCCSSCQPQRHSTTSLMLLLSHIGVNW